MLSPYVDHATLNTARSQQYHDGDREYVLPLASGTAWFQQRVLVVGIYFVNSGHQLCGWIPHNSRAELAVHWCQAEPGITAHVGRPG